jgi:hypothetical protein
MSDIFWIIGADIEKTAAALSAAIQGAGLQRAWIEEVHWIGEPWGEPENKSGDEVRELFNGARPVVYRWAPGTLLPDFLLHDVCRSLELRERNLLLLAEENGDHMHFTVLCAPQAIGQHNLMPHAHIAGWWALPPQGLPTLPQKLEKSGYDLSCVTWLSGEPRLVQLAHAAFPDARPVGEEPSAVTGRLNLLIHRLDEEKCSHGLMLGQAAGGPVLATLIER